MTKEKESLFSKHTNDRLKQRLDNLYNDRNFYVEINYQTTKQLDQTLLAISAGTMSITLGLLSDTKVNPPDLWPLTLHWSLLVTTIISTVLSMLISRWATGKEIKIIDQKILTLYQEKTDNKKNCITSKTKTISDKNKWTPVVRVCNIISVVSFCFAWPFAAYYVYSRMIGG